MNTISDYLNKIRKKLIDFSKRNSLINYKKPSKKFNVDIIESSIAGVYEKLVLQESKLSFRPLIENKIKYITSHQLDSEIPDDEFRNFILKNEKINPQNTLEKLNDLKHLKTLQFSEELEKKLNNIFLKSNLFIEETGNNILYLSLGFLKWKESNSSSIYYKSPLINIPIKISRVKNKISYNFFIEYSGEDIEINSSLQMKLKNDFNIELPEFDFESNNIVEYFKTLSKFFKQKNWEIIYDIKLNFLAFNKIWIFKDLNPDKWNLSNKNLLKILLEGNEQNENLSITNIENKNELITKIPIVLDADSSQFESIITVLNGKNLVIEGPPGTGKSQTISNLIASLIYEGKKVLFVSEKLAALEVVNKRLKEVGLGEFCLEVHSNKTKKTTLLESIKNRLNKNYKKPHEIEQTKLILEEKQKQIQSYIEALQKKILPINKTVFEMFWLLENYLINLGDNVINIEIKDVDKFSEKVLIEIEELLNIYIKYLKEFKFHTHFWNWIELSKTDFLKKDDFLRELNELVEILSKLTLQIKQLEELFKISFKDISDLRIFSSLYEKINELNIDGNILKKINDKKYQDLIVETYSLEEKLKFLLDVNKDYFNLGNNDELQFFYKNIDSIIGYIDKNKNKFLKFLNFRYLKYLKLTKSFIKNKNIDCIENLLELLTKFKEIADIYNQLEKNKNNLKIELLLKDNKDLYLYIELIHFMENSNIDESIKSKIYQSFEESKLQISKTVELLNEYREKIELIQNSYGLVKEENLINDIFLFFNRIKDFNDYVDVLPQYIEYSKIVSKLKNFNLNDFVVGVENNKIPIHQIKNTFFYNFYNSIIKKILSQNSVLREFNKFTYEEAIRMFKEYDDKLLLLNRKLIAAKAADVILPASNYGPRVKDYTELKLLKHEINKKKRHIPLRSLFTRAGKTIQALKPVFMMSPLSVSQYLPQELLEFDVLIIDEASQLKPEEAIGSFLRAKQAVIVGDPKQLPPTSFFDIKSDEEEETALDNIESILDISIEQFRNVKKLKWHYRSRHESLIAFSNEKFYNNELILFPSPYRSNDGELGVYHTYITNAVYYSGQRYNPIEAGQLVEYLKNQIKKYPDKSIGIVTFNTTQRDYIQELVDNLEKKDEEFSIYLNKWKETSEPFFVKNLESVQGDERDVILISTTFGPDSNTSKVMQRFGPINSEMGWRRLNVLITRAKEKLHVFTSLKSSNIIIGNTSSRGLRAFKEFLKYLETKQILDIKIENKDFDSPFEESVYKLLKSYDYEVTPQLGVAGYYIDLAVKYKNTNDYILAIECDGATYHSSQYARDRDKLKDEVLKRLGWNIYRIWSVDWYKNRDAEIKQLLNAIKKAEKIYEERFKNKIKNFSIELENKEKENLENIKKVQITQEESLIKTEVSEDKKQILKKELFQIKEKIEKTFEKSTLLSPYMIDLFILTKPIDMDEFRKKIPLKIREKINKDELVYIDEIFEKIENY